MRCKIELLSAGITDGTMQRWREAIHRCNRIHLPLEGKAYYNDAQSPQYLTPGSVYFLINSFARNFNLTENERYHHLYLDFQTKPPLVSREALVIDPKNDPVTHALLDSVEAIIRVYDPERLWILEGNQEAFEQIRRLLEVLIRHLQLQYHIRMMENEKIEQVIHYMEAHYNEPIQNEDIAKVLHIDSKYLIRLFSRYMDMSPYRYLTQYRIEHALVELRSGKSIADTAYACGFQSENAFRIAFKRIMGYSPAAMMRQR